MDVNERAAKQIEFSILRNEIAMANLIRVSVVSEQLLATFAAVLVVKHLHHVRAIGRAADGERCPGR